MLKIIGFAFGVIVFLLILKAVLPWLVLYLALCGVWHLWQDHTKPKP